MKLRPFSTWRQENKELLVFLAIAFACLLYTSDAADE